MSAATPGQALSPDPADFVYHVRATAFNVLTGKMAGDEWSVPRSERDAIARAVVDAVEPLIRADERAIAAQEPHAATVYRLACGCPIAAGKNPLGNWTCVMHGPTTMIGESAEQPAPELAAATDTAQAQTALSRVLSWFPLTGTRNEATATRAQLAHAHRDGGLTVPEELRRFL